MRFGFHARTRALLEGVQSLGTISAAAARIGMDPSNASRHLSTAERRNGVTLVRRHRGGKAARNATLTAAGRRLLDVRARPGVALDYDPHEGVTPVRIGGRRLYLGGYHAPGPVELEIRSEAVALERPARDRPASSVRNRLAARVSRIERRADGLFSVGLTAGSLAFEALVVQGAVRDLRLRAGSRVHATVKAVSLRAVSRTP
jgi:molybdate transport repressor ModE-like protein